jgi:hypothetical protein
MRGDARDEKKALRRFTGQSIGYCGQRNLSGRKNHHAVNAGARSPIRRPFEGHTRRKTVRRRDDVPLPSNRLDVTRPRTRESGLKMCSGFFGESKPNCAI